MNRLLILSAAICASLSAGGAAPEIPAELYQTTNVWTVHLRFSADEWKAMEPKRAEGGGGFGFGGPGQLSDGRDSFLQGKPGQRNGLASAIGFEFGYVHADLDFSGMKFADVGIRYKGNGTYMESQGGDKRPLKVDLKHFVKGQKLVGRTTLNFQNNTTDPGMMNDALAYRLFRDAGVPAPRTSYAKVYVDAPGEHTNAYFGLYTLVETVDAAFAKERFGEKGGLVLKPVTSRLFSDLGDDWAKYEGPYDPKTKATKAQKERVIEFAKFVSHADDAEFARRFGEFVDVEEFARFMAVTVWLSNFDSLLDMGQNFYLHLDPRSQKLSFIPWDLDHSWGTFGMKGTQEQREQLSIAHPWTGQNRFLERAFGVEAFQTRYRTELTRINATLAQPERLRVQVDEVAAAIREAVKAEGEDKGKRFEQTVGGETPASAMRGGPPGEGGGQRRGGGGFGFPNSKPVKAFVVARHASVTEQLAGKSKGMEVQDMMFGGGPGGGRGGPGGPRGGFGPGNFLAGPIVERADSDKDGKVDAKELHALAEKWFTAWDAAKAGQVEQPQVSAGLNAAFPPPPGMDGPPGGGGRRGGPPGGGFGPGNFIGPGMFAAMDADKDKSVTKAEFLAAFDHWAKTWDSDQKGLLDEEKIRAGVNKDWAGPGGGRPGFGGPGGPPPEGP